MSIKEKPVQEAIDRFREAAVADAQSSTEESKSKLAWAELALWEAIGASTRAEVAAAVKRADRGRVQTIQDTVQSLFPDGTVVYCKPDHGGAFEINGLSKGSIPQNCEVLASGQEKRVAHNGRREHFLVKAGDAVFFFRICSAAPGSGFDESVAGRGYAHASDAGAPERLEAYARDAMQALCN
jgi:hypothetical protein